MTDESNEIQRLLRTLDRPIPSARSAHRRHIVLEEFDTVWAHRRSASRLDDSTSERSVEFAVAPDSPSATSRRRRDRFVLAAAVLLVVVALGVAALASRESAPAPEAAEPVGGTSSVDLVGARVREFCAIDLPDVGSALQRYAAGDLGGGIDVAPLKRAVVDPLNELLDDLRASGFTASGGAELRTALDELESTFLQVDVTTQVDRIYRQLAIALDGDQLPGADSCNSELLSVEGEEL